MITTLRQLLIQRAARLQERPALTVSDWGTLDYFRLRNRIEGVALGLMAAPPAGGAVYSRTGTAWDWVGEVAAACCGHRWEPQAPQIGVAVLGGPGFNDEAGRQPYHDRDQDLAGTTPFLAGLTQGELLVRLQRLNGRLGWDHETRLLLPLAWISTEAGRVALWSSLYAGAHAELAELPQSAWDATPFQGFCSE